MTTTQPSAWKAEEADALLGIAGSLAEVRAGLGDLLGAVATQVRSATDAVSAMDAERGFEGVARRIRADWLRSVSSETARVPRSPTARDAHRLERDQHDAYGYERDFQPESLEARCAAFMDPLPPGWRASHVLFSSAQAALTNLLLLQAEHTRGKASVAHLGGYFETRDLVDRACQSVPRPTEADCVILEPISWDGRFQARDVASVASALRAGQMLLVDETLTAPSTQIPAILGAAPNAPDLAVVGLVSGLKLLQQGLELANVGLVTIHGRDARRVAALAEALRHFRTLTGAGLRFVDALALEAPFFLDRHATHAYVTRIFDHNAALDDAVRLAQGQSSQRPDSGRGGLTVPYCVFQSRPAGVQGLQDLAARVERECRARGLRLERGGSFGFRGHRFDVIEPETGEAPFLRVAMGARRDPSCCGVIRLFADLAGEGVLV